MLGNVAALPSAEEVDDAMMITPVKEVLDATIGDPVNRTRELHELAKHFLTVGDVELALKVVLL
jgi:hypothetical protein